MTPTCPFDGAQLKGSHDADGYTMFICPVCDARFHADAFVSQPVPQYEGVHPGWMLRHPPDKITCTGPSTFDTYLDRLEAALDERMRTRARTAF